MRYLMIFWLVALISSESIAEGVTENAFWTSVTADTDINQSTLEKKHTSRFYLKEEAFRQSVGDEKGSLIQIPLLNGNFVALEATETSVMAEALAAKYPEIKHWRVKGSDNPHIYGVMGFTSLGFHAMLFMSDGDTVFIDREHHATSEQATYRVLSKRSSTEVNPFSCGVHNTLSPVIAVNKTTPDSASTELAAREARGLVTYRLAMAATGEYTVALGGKANAMSEIATTVARLNEVYSRDLALVFQLVANNDAIVFTNQNTDPYSNGSKISQLADENAWQRDSAGRITGLGVIDRFIGSANYDIGHVMSVTRGGIAFVGGVCQVNRNSGNHKAGASTGSANPTGENFYIDFVAHEIGHQLGATHTFNSSTGSCAGAERSAATAYEPGSGSSIMAYAGICTPNNVQNHSDAVFHIASIEQIDSYVRRGQGRFCGGRGASTNNAPDILSVTENLTVNANTAFTLAGSASDSDGDRLSYAWDQFDQGTASAIDVDQGNNALFRSQLPSSSASRTFSGLATTNRELTFKFVVRDGVGGVSSRATTVRVVNGNTNPNLNAGSNANDNNSGNGGGGTTTPLMLLGLLLMGLLKRLYRRAT